MAISIKQYNWTNHGPVWMIYLDTSDRNGIAEWLVDNIPRRVNNRKRWDLHGRNLLLTENDDITLFKLRWI